MIERWTTLLLLTLFPFFTACGGTSEPNAPITAEPTSGAPNVPGTPMTTTNPPAPLAKPRAVSMDPSGGALDVGQSVALRAHASYDSGAPVDVTDQASWVSSAPNIIAMNGSIAIAVGAGVATVTVSFQGQSDQRTLEARSPITVTALELSPTSASLAPGQTVQLSATALKSDGARESVTGQATWRSSNSGAVTVDAAGLATAVGAGQADISAAFGGREASATISVTVCSYPQAPSQISATGVLPNMNWVGAYDAAGNRVDFSTSNFFCDPSYANYDSLHFIISAGWCPNCPSYLQDVASNAAQIQAAGGLVVYVEIEDENYSPASHGDARQGLNRYVGMSAGLRIGDGETMPNAMTFGNAVSSVPNAFVVRKSDMRIIANQGGSNSMLDFVALAQQLHGGGGGGGGGGGAHCGPNDEESFEPNDQASQAGSIAAGAVVDGGLCDANKDFYQVTHAGAWRLDLLFSHATGDLDVYVYDPATGQAARDSSGRKIGSEGTVDNESFEYMGVATVMVVGYQGATAPYQLHLTGL